MVKVFSVVQPMLPNESDVELLDQRTKALDASEALDRVLVGYSSIWAHNHAYAPHMLASTKRLSLIVAHRPGVMDPAAAARYFATLDVVSRGRLAINIVIGGSDKDLHREGDYTAKAERYARANEYLDVMRQTWTEPKSFDHDGAYYKEERVKPLIRPVQGQVPIYMGGDSADAVDFGARHADTYMLWGEPQAGTRERISNVERAAVKYERTPEFSLSLRLFLGETDQAAWEAAHRAEKLVVQAVEANLIPRSSMTDKSIGRERQLTYAESDVHDDCFWTRLVPLLGGFANAAALVGTPDRVMRTLERYRDLGVNAFLFTGGPYGIWEPELEDFAQRVKREL